MWDSIIGMAGKESLFALLFVGLLVYTIKRNEKRETLYLEREVKYQVLVERLTKIIKDELCDIKEKISEFTK